MGLAGWRFFYTPCNFLCSGGLQPYQVILLDASQVTYCILVERQLNNSWKHLSFSGTTVIRSLKFHLTEI